MEITFKNVDFEYLLGTRLSYKAINNVSFRIKEKKITVIVGESGSGKSTLLSLMADILKPTGGEIVRERIDSKDIGFLFQKPDSQFFCNTIYEELAFTLKKRHVFKNELDKRILDSLKMVGLNESYLNRSPLEISRGEQKKLALAILLAYNPKVLILDEAFSGLDAASKRHMIKLFKMMKLRYDKTIILATSDVDLAHEIADEVIGINNGKIVFCGNKFDLFTNSTLLKTYNIGMPKLIKFTNLVKKSKNINIGYRDEINDVMKDVYRYVK